MYVPHIHQNTKLELLSLKEQKLETLQPARFTCWLATSIHKGSLAFWPHLHFSKQDCGKFS